MTTAAALAALLDEPFVVVVGSGFGLFVWRVWFYRWWP